jgi:hypothetical protein
MTTKFSMRAASVSAMAANVFCKHFGGKREEEERRGSQVWREEVAGILAANLTNLDALSHGFVPSHVQRMTGF